MKREKTSQPPDTRVFSKNEAEKCPPELLCPEQTYSRMHHVPRTNRNSVLSLTADIRHLFLSCQRMLADE